jgi:NTE family protein
MKYITHLIFSGNALKSISLCGVLRYLYFNNLDRNIHDVAATSMGAFFALAFALKIPIEKLESMILTAVKDEKITKFQPASFINIINNFGLCCSIDYLNVYKSYLKEMYDQEDITFLELSKKTGVNIYVSTTRVDTGANVIFNVNDTPNISVLKAIAASMCIPMVSQPIIIDGHYYVDGYLTNNFPVELFSHINKKNILAISSDISKSYEMIPNEKNTQLSIFEYYFNILFIYHINNYKLCYLNKINNFEDVLIIDTKHCKVLFSYNKEENYLDFSLSDEELHSLFLIGYKAIYDYMESKNEEIVEV